LNTAEKFSNLFFLCFKHRFQTHAHCCHSFVDGSRNGATTLIKKTTLKVNFVIWQKYNKEKLYLYNSADIPFSDFSP